MEELIAQLCQCKEAALHAISVVFRRLLANLLLDCDNEKFRTVRKDNPFVLQNTAGLSESLVHQIFQVMGFALSESNAYVFEGSRETLLAADQLFSSVENTYTITNDPVKLVAKKPIVHSPERTAHVSLQNQNLIIEGEDFTSVEGLKDIARKTLLKTGRIRNSFFEAKDYTLRRMTHGRVFVCSEKCGNDCLEAHWHLFSGRNILYSHVAHLNPDGTEILHLGYEIGYQYNSIPGMADFGKTVNFSTKHLSLQGKLVLNEHPNKVSDSCVYCAKGFKMLFF